MTNEFFEAYTNHVSITTGVYDVVFDFFVVPPPINKPNQVAEPKLSARVRMSPQHAFALSKVLTKTLNDYQQKFGKIELPKALCDELGI